MTDYHSDFEYISRSMLVDFVDRAREVCSLVRPRGAQAVLRILTRCGLLGNPRDQPPGCYRHRGKCLEIPADTLDKNGHRTGNNFKRFRAEASR